MIFEEIRVDQPVAWIHLPHGEHGFAVPVDAIVMRAYFSRGGAPRVRIKVPLKDGRFVERCVSPETLRTRTW